MLFGGPQISNGKTNRESVIQARVGNEDLAGGVHAIHQRLVRRIIGLQPETDCAERNRRHNFESRVRLDQRREELSQADVFADTPAKCFDPEVTHDHPELQRTEPPAELQRVVRGVGC